MRYIILDLEMNNLDAEYKEERKICRAEVIEFGAVMLDDAYQEISRFQTYVMPQYAAEIRSNIVRLTGITTEMVTGSPVFETAFRQFSDWCFQFEGPCEVHSWSENDYQQISSEINLKEYKLNENEKMLLSGWKNFQKEYMEALGLDRAIALEKALEYADIDFRGRQHDALFDAKNTADLFEIVHNKELFEVRLNKVVEALKPSSLSVSLGDLFNFEDFQ